MGKTRLLFGGDFVISEEIGSSDILDSKLIKFFEQSNFNIMNLEAPVTDSSSKILKTGPHLKSNKVSTLEVLNALSINIVTLANNHVMDYDEEGLSDTLNFCKEKNIKTVGAGMNLRESSQTLYLDTKEGMIAIINFAENEWASSTNDSAGANPMDIIDNARQIKDAHEQADFVFVVIHGGHEYYNLPSPRMQKQYRFYAEQGADIVIGHHTHCISGNEVYNGVPIYYSLGNFLFTSHSTYKEWYFGLVLEIEIKEGKILTYLHPVKQQESTFKLSLLNKEEKQVILNRILVYNSIIEDEFKLKREWNEFIDVQYNKYINWRSPISFISNRYVKGLLLKLGMKGLNKLGIAYSLNLMRCEAHADLSKEVMKKYLMK